MVNYKRNECQVDRTIISTSITLLSEFTLFYFDPSLKSLEVTGFLRKEGGNGDSKNQCHSNCYRGISIGRGLGDLDTYKGTYPVTSTLIPRILVIGPNIPTWDLP